MALNYISQNMRQLICANWNCSKYESKIHQNLPLPLLITGIDPPPFGKLTTLLILHLTYKLIYPWLTSRLVCLCMTGKREWTKRAKNSECCHLAQFTIWFYFFLTFKIYICGCHSEFNAPVRGDKAARLELLQKKADIWITVLFPISLLTHCKKQSSML